MTKFREMTVLIADPYRRRFPPGDAITTKRVTATMRAREFIPMSPLFKGYALTGHRNALRAYMKKHGFKELTIAQLRDGSYAFIAAPPLPEGMVEMKDEKGYLKANPTVTAEIRASLEALALATGYRMCFQTGWNDACIPFKKEKDTIHIVFGTSPPGWSKWIQGTELCGVPFRGNTKYFHRTAARERGYILRDDRNIAFAQIIDSTLYLLGPVGQDAPYTAYGSHGGSLFVRMLAPAWDAFITGKAVNIKTQPLWAPEEFEIFFSEVFGNRRLHVEAGVREYEERAAKLHEQFLDTLGVVEGNRHLLLALDSEYEKRDHTALTARWKEFREHPLIHRLYTKDSVFYVETEDIIAEYEGVEYCLGRFTIQCEPTNKTAVWAHKSTHPKNISHPHISPSGVVCFGNVDTAVHEASMQINPIESVTLVLRWLVDGYDPKLADTPIQEWPVVRRKKHVKGKLRASKKAVRSEKAKRSNALRRRISRQLRGFNTRKSGR